MSKKFSYSKTILFIPIIALLFLPLTGEAFAEGISEEDKFAIAILVIVAVLIIAFAWIAPKIGKGKPSDKDKEKDE